MTDHAREAAEKIFPKPLVASPDATWWHMTITKQHRDNAVKVIKAAIDAACAEEDLHREDNEGSRALWRLDEWKSANKRRSVNINIDDGRGATCWEVRLDGENAGFVHAFEHCGNQTDNRVSVMSDGGDWPGLGATIMAALDRWEKLYGEDNETKDTQEGI